MEIAFPPIFFSAFLFFWKEERRVRRQFYTNPLFRRADKALKKRYRFKNPYSISRRFLTERGARDVHVYGETPLTALEQIGEIMGLTKNDIFLDLGCGRGRGVFFLRCRFQCQAIGIDWIPDFIEEAKAAADEAKIPAQFFCADMADSTWIHQATAIFLAWTCLDDNERESIERTLGDAKEGARVVTVSSPLQSKNFILKETALLAFPWGKAEVFFHERKNPSLY